jgi:hypothetical protein
LAGAGHRARAPSSEGEWRHDQPGISKALLKTMMAFWKEAFAAVLGHQ